MNSVPNRSLIVDYILSDQSSFDEKALALYEYQAIFNPLYRQYINIVKYNGFVPGNVNEIPFLPIALFKSNIIKTGEWKEEVIFHSSGTTEGFRSKHYIRDIEWYRAHTRKIWRLHFNPLASHTFLSLLPNYHEQPHSSLLYMVDEFIESGQQVGSHHFLTNHQDLHDKINELSALKIPVVLFGVSFALLEYVRSYQHPDARNLMVIETGGMKKFGKAITREALHQELAKGFRGARIISEYGMTECLSQMYCLDNESFIHNDFIKAFISDPTDPGTSIQVGSKGKINIIDLANIDTIGFIGTDDLGFINGETDQLHILGRLDNSDIRGCNYLL